mmetsp:Transcript_9041/g.13881  ORF Transcript_9041/g.13881 Transcript_9041/m.13881 type:complete len:82 (-) Transcript_9041:66-311(-)|eukprot:CAMPEP_0178902722 /NCGR_PEP_ID=MMETSP0786-20121207/4765_1 /TAXON_ID=186022 /ORGANISM="Thalassionema frauenfeldii, Strain CCMP 1798" /LENGTH=81 /DNA_ID=CAMNT_0020574025 /DNA_START=1321 /DNA_END=1562 /DNA_ORIENTATION=+
MGGAPWVVRVYKTKVTIGVGDQVYGETKDKDIVKEANNLMDRDATGSTLDEAIYHGKQPFEELSQAISGGPALDSLTAVRG